MSPPVDEALPPELGKRQPGVELAELIDILGRIAAQQHFPVIPMSPPRARTRATTSVVQLVVRVL